MKLMNHPLTLSPADLVRRALARGDIGFRQPDPRKNAYKLVVLPPKPVLTPAERRAKEERISYYAARNGAMGGAPCSVVTPEHLRTAWHLIKKLGLTYSEAAKEVGLGYCITRHHFISRNGKPSRAMLRAIGKTASNKIAA
jgi:hypothetical protein